jgi:hypothetical protein
LRLRKGMSERALLRKVKSLWALLAQADVAPLRGVAPRRLQGTGSPAGW